MITPISDVLEDDGTIPHNGEVEQCLLGMLLFDNVAYERIGDLRPDQFYEGLHARLFVAIEDAIRRGLTAEPILLMDRFKGDPDFQELGGVRYLADLVDRAPPAILAAQYAERLVDLADRRELIRIANQTGYAARHSPDAARDQLEDAERKLYQLAEHGRPAGGFVPLDVAADEAVDLASQAYSRDGGLAGVSTGLADLDQKLGGLHPSDLVILAARPSMGKTALAVTRTFAAQVEALGKLRAAGKQVIEVQHVHVYPGGQAVVGTVNAGSGAAGGATENSRQPRALGGPDALGSALWSEDAARFGLSVPGGQGPLEVPDARRGEGQRGAKRGGQRCVSPRHENQGGRRDAKAHAGDDQGKSRVDRARLVGGDD